MASHAAAITIAFLALFTMGCVSSGYGGLTASDASNLITSTPNLTIIDLRTPAEFGQGHIKGAINIDYESEGFRGELSGFDRDSAYIVYCKIGRKSGPALDIMRGMGFRNVSHIGGGISEWAAEGFPTE